ncbi:efflux transporter outer membrane subunit [bacterium]|nr:efflux transporter outer membrane subunit [bacterium]
MKRIIPFAVVLMLTGCSLVPEYMRPSMNTPESWKEDTTQTTQEQAPANWWKNFNNDELNALVDQALKENHDVKAGIARVEQARASTTVAGASLLPNANASGNASRNDTDKTKADNSARIQGSISYEVDLFGKNRAGVEAAAERYTATQYDQDALRIITAADVTQAYFNSIGLQKRLEIARKNLENQEEVLKIVDAQYTEGRLSALELSQQKSQLASSRAQLASIENQLALSLNQLAVLTGHAPKDLVAPIASLDDAAIPDIAPTLPSALIEQRPDIRASEAGLKAANADIGAARAAFFPSLTLSANAALLASPSSVATGLVASMLAPIFQGGRLEGELERTKARQLELAENYQQIVLTSFREVEDALAGIKSSAERQTQLDIASTEAAEANRIARARYDAGATDFQTFLDTQRTQLQADDGAIQARLDRLNAAVQLYKALGGDVKISAE